MEYYKNWKCRQVVDFTGRARTFWVTGFPKWKILSNHGFMEIKNTKTEKWYSVPIFGFCIFYLD